MTRESARRRRAPALTESHVARVARAVPELPPSGRFTKMEEADYERLADLLLARNEGAPFWVFAYGSLIWKPAFEHVETRHCVAHGWRRAFCLDLRDWRGTPEEPGLMLALARGGACAGVAYRMPADDPKGRMRRLLDREMGFREAIPWIRWMNVRASGAAFRALAFYCAPPAAEGVVHLPLDEQARRIARAAGPAGSCAEYLRNTIVHLDALGLRDRYLWRLQALVAAEIDGLDDAR